MLLNEMSNQEEVQDCASFGLLMDAIYSMYVLIVILNPDFFLNAGGERVNNCGNASSM